MHIKHRDSKVFYNPADGELYPDCYTWGSKGKMELRFAFFYSLGKRDVDHWDGEPQTKNGNATWIWQISDWEMGFG